MTHEEMFIRCFVSYLTKSMQIGKVEMDSVLKSILKSNGKKMRLMVDFQYNKPAPGQPNPTLDVFQSFLNTMPEPEGGVVLKPLDL